MVLPRVLTEVDLFIWLKRHYYYDLRSSGGQYSFYDCYSLEFRFYAELKMRSKHYDTLLIERSKYDRIVKIANANRSEALYIVGTPLGVWQYEVATLGIDWVDMPDLPVTSQFENKERVTKKVGLLPLNEATQLGEVSNTRKGGVMYGDR